MYALFRLQEAVSIVAVHLEGGALHTSFITGLIVQHLQRKAVLLCKAGEHSEQHAGPVLRLGATGTGVQGNDGVVRIIFTAQQHA